MDWFNGSQVHTYVDDQILLNDNPYFSKHSCKQDNL